MDTSLEEEDMGIYLKNLAVRNFRGIGSDYEEAIGFGQFNIFCGANNSGKSTFLDLISRYLPISERAHRSKIAAPEIRDLDYHLGNRNTISLAIGFDRNEVYETVLSTFTEDYRRLLSNNLKSVISAMSKDGIVWIENHAPYKNGINLRDFSLEKARELVIADVWRSAWRNLTGKSNGDLNAHWIPETTSTIISKLDLNLPPIHSIPAMRQIGPKGQSFSTFNGIGLIEKLAELQNPGALQQQDKMIFEKINLLLQSVTKSSDAKIEIPHHREYILVQMNGRTLPLSSLGTGIEQIIMIASFCTVANELIICLEEPELHLHPIYQRRLIDYLKNNTNNQYFISTHSAAIIDFSDASVYRVRQDNNKTRISNVISKQDRFDACVDLGHKASDIVQSNYIIWVEGPSDRIYLNHWISSIHPSLKESIHYSVMFYGGRLLSHLTASDEEVTSFISLRQLNRNLAIIIDSDRRSANSRINPTKSRVRDEIEKEGGVIWITKGREIESYIKHDLLQNAVQATHPGYLSPATSGGQFEHILHFKKEARGKKVGEIETAVDKVKVARKVCESPADLDVYDLKSQILKLVAMIRKANGME